MGEIVQAAWDVLPKHYPNVTLSAFCVMPNHVHGIVVLTELPADVTPYPLSEIVRAFKSYSARKINHIYRRPGISLWQKNYYEVIIRRQVEWDKIRAYIESNPSNWEKDKFYVRPNTDH